VNGNLVDVAVTTTVVKELGHPIITVGGRGGAGASKSVTLIGERPDVRIPSTDGVRDTSVGLSRFVDLVETKDVRSITRLSELEETVDLVLTSAPEHNAGGNAGVLDRRRDFRVPEMEHLDTGRSGEEGNPLVVAHSPSNSEFSRT